jgi:hypothetical protein
MTQNKRDPAATLNTIVGEADELIRQRLKELALQVPHVVRCDPTGPSHLVQQRKC